MPCKLSLKQKIRNRDQHGQERKHNWNDEQRPLMYSHLVTVLGFSQLNVEAVVQAFDVASAFLAPAN